MYLHNKYLLTRFLTTLLPTYLLPLPTATLLHSCHLTTNTYTYYILILNSHYLLVYLLN